jgi:AcrR family transcriptional regulator
VSAHERERLSAYLDGELPPGERALVAAHLAGCEDCAAFLAGLEAADRAGAQLSAEPPAGYFDGFAARVVERIEARKTAARARRPPPWAWAAAAALLLAVVTPLTLHRSGTAPAKPPRPAVLGPNQATPAPPAPEPERKSVPARPAAPSASAPPASVPPVSGEGVSPAGRTERSNEAQTAFAREPARPSGAASLAGGAAPPAMAESGVSPAPPAALPEARGKGPGERVRTQAADSMLERPTRDVEVSGFVGVEDAEAAFRRLLGRRPHSVDGWRLLRDDWAAFAAAEPDSPRADEARVRAIEAGYEAWRAGGGPGDEAAFRRDVRAYLERADARQADRVKGLGTPP